MFTIRTETNSRRAFLRIGAAGLGALA